MIHFNRSGLLGAGGSALIAGVPFYLVGWDWEGFIIASSSLMSLYGILFDRVPEDGAWKAYTSFLKGPFRDHGPSRVALFCVPLIAAPYLALIGAFAFPLLGNQKLPSTSYFIGIMITCVAITVLGFSTVSIRATLPRESAEDDALVAERERWMIAGGSSRRRQRGLVMLAFIVVGGFVAFLGLGGMTIDGLPAHYLGFLLIGLAVLGILGVNVWKGGPLDRNDD